jgi:Gram-negative bacterial TonB protein C-terminal
MTSVTAFMPGPRTSRRASQRLSISFALSIIAHAILIAMFAGLLQPMLTPLAGRVGQALPIEVALVGVRPIAFAAPPEVPATAVDLHSGPTPMDATPPAPAASPSTPLQTATPIANPFGVSVQSDPNASEISADFPPPPGSTSVGPVIDSERLGHAQALRLAQRFPRTAAKQAQLRDPLIVPYPPNAARAHAEARIAALLFLDATGKVVETTLFPDEPMFGPTVLDALRRARFAPAEVNAQPAPYWLLLEFVFKLGTPSVTPRVKS